MKETIQVLNWDRTVAGRIYAENVEELLESGRYEIIDDGVLRCKQKDDNNRRPRT